MTEKLETLVILADGVQARGLAERRRHGPLAELASWSLKADEADRHLAGTHGGTVTDRVGYGRDNVLEAPPAEAAEKRFLEGVAERINRSAAAGEFERLVLMAPPRALGVLRQALKPAVLRRIDVTDDHERIKATAEEVRVILRDLRIPDR
ncbi:MAG: host attachment protein [Phenylobacterium sp.]|uniref:host attachment protein n=1 Tax=Phenylobacterium sp. TaxID=1871053 RepID=UPI001A1BEB5D|nr:host attachment protein [Phenylobacterium sp.]MBJ7409411.1 host attachment protein [Phenylobacterium sp.]